MAAPIPKGTSIDQSRDFYLTVTWKDSNQVPINLTGYTATFSMRQNHETPVILTVTSANGITLGGSTGVITVHLTNGQTGMDEGNYVAELVLTSGAGIETSLLKGYLPVTAKVVE